MLVLYIVISSLARCKMSLLWQSINKFAQSHRMQFVYEKNYTNPDTGYINEPRHDISDKMSVRPAKTDQPGPPPSLIRA